MSVYIDELFSTAKTIQWPYPEACHLFSQNRHELHDMAFKLGLHPRWFDNQSHFPHYDLTRGKRFHALRLGAVQVTEQQAENFQKNSVIDEDLNDGT